MTFCTDGLNWWTWVVSYLSSEPFVAGTYPIKQVTNIHAVYFQDLYMFVVDGSPVLVDGPFNGVYIYKFNYDNSTATEDLQLMFVFNEIMLLSDVTERISNWQVMPNPLPNTYQLFVTTTKGYLYSFFLNCSATTNYNAFGDPTQISINALVPSTQLFSPALVSVHAFNYTVADKLFPFIDTIIYYSFIAVYNDYNCYEFVIPCSAGGLCSDPFVVNIFYRYGTYLNWGNVQVTD